MTPSASTAIIAQALSQPKPARLQAASGASRKNWPLLALGSHTQP
jgi:hypothetical protein